MSIRELLKVDEETYRVLNLGNLSSKDFPTDWCHLYNGIKTNHHIRVDLDSRSKDDPLDALKSSWGQIWIQQIQNYNRLNCEAVIIPYTICSTLHGRWLSWIVAFDTHASKTCSHLPRPGVVELSFSIYDGLWKILQVAHKALVCNNGLIFRQEPFHHEACTTQHCQNSQDPRRYVVMHLSGLPVKISHLWDRNDYMLHPNLFGRPQLWDVAEPRPIHFLPFWKLLWLWQKWSCQSAALNIKNKKISAPMCFRIWMKRIAKEELIMQS